MRVALLVVLSLIVQRALGWSGMPAWCQLLILPMVWIVAPALHHHDRRWTLLAVLLGLTWDLVLDEQVVGPGGIAWSAAALGLGALASVVADRSAKAWFAFGAVGTLVVEIVQRLVLLPLGHAEPLVWRNLLASSALTACWCAAVGWIRALDLPSRWQSWRSRRLR
jgi:hypothetical protein